MGRLLAVPVEVRRENDGVHALRRLHAEEGQAGLHVLRPIVHPRENVGVQVGHGGPSPIGAPSGAFVPLL